MERLIAWYRMSSSVLALVALIVANLIPLAGVLFLGWSVWQILIIYWLENGIVGGFNVLKMRRAQGGGDGTSVAMTLNGRRADEQSRTWLIGFFCMHYGM